MIAAVFDCMVFLQGAMNRSGPAGACFEMVDEGRVHLFVSPQILAEVREVLSRRPLRRSFPKLLDEHVEVFIDQVLENAEMIESVPLVHRLPDDPKDEPYLNLALAAKTKFIVSWDHDLLDLMKDRTFRKQHPALSIVTPPAFLRHLRTKGEQQAA